MGRAQGAVAGAAHAGAGQDQRGRGGAGVAHPELVDGVQALSREFALPIVCFGHAGNGNLHVNILFDPADAAQSERAQAALARVFALTLSLGGTLSGEHGIGLAKRDFMPQAIDAADAGADARDQGGVRSGRDPQSREAVAVTRLKVSADATPCVADGQPKCS